VNYNKKPISFVLVSCSKKYNPAGVSAASLAKYTIMYNLNRAIQNTSKAVFIDDSSVGEVSTGKLLKISVNEGGYFVKVCSGQVCERHRVEIKAESKPSMPLENN
jgi:hypothetical protein